MDDLAEARLKRIEAAKPPPAVRVYQLDNGKGAWPYWLCGRHKAKRVLDGYVVVSERDPKHEILCDDRALFECGEEMRP